MECPFFGRAPNVDGADFKHTEHVGCSNRVRGVRVLQFLSVDRLEGILQVHISQSILDPYLL